MASGENADEENQRQVLRRLQAALPVDDLLGWLIVECPTAGRDQVLALLKAVYAAGWKIGPANQEQRLYRVGDEELRAYPQRVEAG
ncbi:MAG: hypothetical protein GKR89_30920 [Candidatus Latescibacteria bacterium]|nr:hypothetical protein [Candidatus Latescibacterota bacterium]